MSTALVADPTGVKSGAGVVHIWHKSDPRELLNCAAAAAQSCEFVAAGILTASEPAFSARRREMSADEVI